MVRWIVEQNGSSVRDLLRPEMESGRRGEIEKLPAREAALIAEIDRLGPRD